MFFFMMLWTQGCKFFLYAEQVDFYLGYHLLRGMVSDLLLAFYWIALMFSLRSPVSTHFIIDAIVNSSLLTGLWDFVCFLLTFVVVWISSLRLRVLLVQENKQHGNSRRLWSCRDRCRKWNIHSPWKWGERLKSPRRKLSSPSSSQMQSCLWSYVRGHIFFLPND